MRADKALGRKLGICLYYFGLVSGFLDVTAKTQGAKEKKGTLYFIKLKTFCGSEHTNEVRKQSRKWE